MAHCSGTAIPMFPVGRWERVVGTFREEISVGFPLDRRTCFIFLIGSFALSAGIKCLNCSTAHILNPQGSFSSPAWLLAFDHNLFISSRPHPKKEGKDKTKLQTCELQCLKLFQLTLSPKRQCIRHFLLDLISTRLIGITEKVLNVY